MDSEMPDNVDRAAVISASCVLLWASSIYETPAQRNALHAGIVLPNMNRALQVCGLCLLVGYELRRRFATYYLAYAGCTLLGKQSLAGCT